MITVGQLGLMLALYGQRWREVRRRVLLRRFDERKIRRIPRGMTGDPRVNIARLSAELERIHDARAGVPFRDPGAKHLRESAAFAGQRTP